MAGFITIERDIWDHPLFKRSEMTEREAWMWMLAQSAWDDTRHRVGSEMVDVPRGSFVTTLREMQSVFMWRSDKRVRTFLTMLEGEGMIGRTTVGTANAPKTHVTICKYDKYQIDGRTKDAPKTHGGRTKDAVKEQDNNKTKEDTTVSLKANQKPERFQEFWDAYPHRDGKRKRADAVKAYTKALKAGIQEQTIIDGAARAHCDPTVARGYARDPTSWLNQEGWDDEFPSQPNLTLINGGPHDQSARNNRESSKSDTLRDTLDAAAGYRRTSEANWL